MSKGKRDHHGLRWKAGSGLAGGRAGGHAGGRAGGHAGGHAGGLCAAPSCTQIHSFTSPHSLHRSQTGPLQKTAHPAIICLRGFKDFPSPLSSVRK